MTVGFALGSSSSDSAVKVEKKSILYFDLSGDIRERYTETDFFTAIQSLDKETLTLEDMLRSLAIAADDSKIEGLYLNCNGSSMGTASREELIEGINAFKESGKWVMAYADSYAQGDYVVATTADSLLLNPMGSIDVHGVGSVTPFFKDLLDKVGVKMQIIKVGTFKSAVEPYILSEMSQPARLQAQQYCDTIWSFMAGTIAANRHIAEDSIRSMASQLIFTRKGEAFVSDRLADAICYRRTATDRLRKLTDIKPDKDPRLISPSDYLAASGKDLGFSSKKDHIAVYYAVGEISDSGKEGIVGPTVTKDIIALANDKHVRGMVLRVNSPGGSAFASEQIWEALKYFKSKKKPLYVSMGDYAASGGYYISCCADSIFADRTTLTGSIGVFGMIPDFSGLVTDKLGVHFSTVETNPNGAGVTTLKAMTPTQYAAMQQSVENIYDLFTSRVAEGRHMSQDSVKVIAEGRVWVGSKATELGLVDRLGSLDSTIGALADKLGMDKENVVRYPNSEEKFWQKMLRESGSIDMKAALDSELDTETLRTLHFVKRLRDMAPVQARMEETTVQ